MRELSDADIDAWAAKGELLGCAGAYNIESHLATVEPTECYQNVAGLPLCHLWRALASGAFGDVEGLDQPVRRVRGGARRRRCELGRDVAARAGRGPPSAGSADARSRISSVSASNGLRAWSPNSAIAREARALELVDEHDAGIAVCTRAPRRRSPTLRRAASRRRTVQRDEVEADAARLVVVQHAQEHQRPVVVVAHDRRDRAARAGRAAARG